MAGCIAFRLLERRGLSVISECERMTRSGKPIIFREYGEEGIAAERAWTSKSGDSCGKTNYTFGTFRGYQKDMLERMG